MQKILNRFLIKLFLWAKMPDPVYLDNSIKELSGIFEKSFSDLRKSLIKEI